jgi:hypothetical protein
VSSRRKKLGRDPFEDAKAAGRSSSVEKLIRGNPRREGSAREVEVTVRLTPANLKQLDRVNEQLVKRGRQAMSRDDLIRVAITLLSADDIT